MSVFQELKARGLLAQVTNQEKVEDILTNEKIKFYIGFDPTADSLHVGHFIAVMVMSHMQRAGHIPIALFGGGTGMIGDPSGKTDMRKMMTPETISHNIDCFVKQMSRFIDFSDGKAIMVNNADWLSNLNYIDFLRDIGVHFSVNRMLTAECYKQRLEKGLSFFELNYMIMQSYDFLVLRQKYDCILQMGGDDQWSNILGGIDLNRRVDAKEVYGLTFNLLLTSEGKKMGKTEGGAVWLDPEKTSPYDFYQYWRNVDDTDVIKCLKMLTFLPVDQISEYESLEGSELNPIKELLAFEITKNVHGEEEAKKAQETAKAIFSNHTDVENMPSAEISKDLFKDETIEIADLLVEAGLAKSKGEAKRLIKQGGISIDDKKISDPFGQLEKSYFDKGYVVAKKGKKTFIKVTLS